MLLGVIAIVVIIDFTTSSLKKKGDSENNYEKIEGVFKTKSQGNLSYFFNRKRNIITFLLLVALMKPAVHYVFFEEMSDERSTIKVDLGKFNESFVYVKNTSGDLLRYKSQSRYYSEWRRDRGTFTKEGYSLFTSKAGDYFYYLPKKVEFKEYIKNKFTSKPFIFLISFGVLGLFVFLMNDKIRAR